MALEDWVKGDGARIEIVFTEPITFFKTFDPSHFKVISNEYNWVPNGELINIEKNIAHVYIKTLNIKPTSFIYNIDSIDIEEDKITLKPNNSHKNRSINFLNTDNWPVENVIIINRSLSLSGDLKKKTIRKNYLIREEGIWVNTVYSHTFKNNLLNKPAIILSKEE